jgi:zinc protease
MIATGHYHLARRLALLAGALAAASVASAEGPAAAGVKPAPPALLLPAPSTPLIAVRFVFRAGSQDDPPGKEGLAALTASMISEGGTRGLTYDQLLARFYPIAAKRSPCFPGRSTVTTSRRSRRSPPRC